MSIATLLPLILIVGVMFLMTRSAKTKQRQAAEMRNAMAPGSGVRTIGGMYALVKSVNDETVELEIAPGVVTHYAKNAIAAVLDQDEYDRIVHGVPDEDPELGAEPQDDAPVVLAKDLPDEDGAAEEDAATTTESAEAADLVKKKDAADAE